MESKVEQAQVINQNFSQVSVRPPFINLILHCVQNMEGIVFKFAIVHSNLLPTRLLLCLCELLTLKLVKCKYKTQVEIQIQTDK